MKLILGCDPLLMPLTGIGHYTRNLGYQLSRDPRVGNLQLFAHGKFFSNDLLLPQCVSAETADSAQTTTSQKIRTAMARSSAIVRVYEQVVPLLNRWQLRNHKNAIFHSPNFLMPDFAGRTVVTIHDLSTVRFPEFHPKARVGLVGRAIQKACNKADLLVTDSEYIRNELLEAYDIDPDRIVSQHLGAQEHFKPRTEVQCSPILCEDKLEYKQFFIFVSTLEPRKNLLRILQAYKQYRLDHPNGFPLVLIGGTGWQQASFRDLLQELINNNWVKQLGYVTDNQLAVLFSAARGLLFPSIYEGFGLPVLEAMQSGTAVLTSKDSSMSEITEKAGVLVDPINVEKIAQGIELLHSDHQRVKQLEWEGIERAKSFSWQICSDSMIKHYQAL